MNCPNCENPLLWGGDFDYEDCLVEDVVVYAKN